MFRSISAFINHTCKDENVQVLKAFGTVHDDNAPQLALISKKGVNLSHDCLAAYLPSTSPIKEITDMPCNCALLAAEDIGWGEELLIRYGHGKKD
ncbi:unnamed protein product, partial [Chrysoparadoxa australica]